MDLFEIQKPNIRDRLRYNILPLETERKAVNDSLSVARLRLAEIQASRSSDNHGQEEEQVTLCHYIANYSSLLAPIRRLSDDILRIIFLDPDIHNFRKMGMSPPASMVNVYKPNAIAAVSHQWKTLVWGTPKFWASFHATFWRSRYSVERVRLCLERSKNAPLSMSFAWMRSPKDSDPLLHNDALEAILDHAERWAHVLLPLHPQFLSLL
ncbi:hypothetical protein B0H19DRAFT_164454 [Mycena capillaripes]|nr:hypothetical protein B0H19DRAFT_164454 [Mycena capillaripes]